MSEEPKNYGRWSSWEAKVLSACGDIKELQRTIKKRRSEIDDDDQESDLVRDEIVGLLRSRYENSKEANVFIPMTDLHRRLKTYGNRPLALNKIKPFLERLQIKELTSVVAAPEPGLSGAVNRLKEIATPDKSVREIDPKIVLTKMAIDLPIWRLIATNFDLAWRPALFKLMV